MNPLTRWRMLNHCVVLFVSLLREQPRNFNNLVTVQVWAVTVQSNVVKRAFEESAECFQLKGGIGR